jgi:hypothetical protein
MSIYVWDWSKFVDITATLAAAGAGAWAAFHFNNRRLEKEREDKEKNAANLALMKLCRQYNAIALYVRDELSPLMNSASRHIQVGASRPSLHAQDRINQESLSFLIGHGYTDLLSDILLEDDRFEAILHNIQLRAEHHMLHVQPALEKTGRFVSLEQVSKTLGVRHTKIMENYTDNLYDQTYASLESLFECVSKFHAAMKTLYPSEKFVKIRDGKAFKPSSESTTSLDFRWRWK